MTTDRTIYPLTNEVGEWTTITLPKYIADILQANMPNVHDWLQITYNDIVERFPYLTRREKGKEVQSIAQSKAWGYIDPKELL